MEIFNTIENRLLRYAAKFGSKKLSSGEFTLIMNQLMDEGYFFQEFVYLDDDQLNYEEKVPFIKKVLNQLNWRPLGEKEKLFFLTGFYAEIGRENDISAYHAICQWVKDVGFSLSGYSNVYLGDQINAERIYASYFSPCKYTGYDFISSIEDPQVADWDQLGELRPTIVFSEWLRKNPNFRTEHSPIDLNLLPKFR